MKLYSGNIQVQHLKMVADFANKLYNRLKSHVEDLMNSKQDQSKIRIIEAARVCFARNGYDGTSIRQICEMADANLALVSYYYGSKEKLYLAVIERFSQEANEKFDGGAFTKPEDALKDFIHTFLSMRKQDAQFHMLLRYELSSKSPRKATMDQIFAPYLTYIRRILTEGKDSGVFHYESLDLVLTHILSILAYPAYDSLLLASYEDHQLSTEAEILQTTRFIFAGLSASI
ncbi:TetR/AcrR family transcriptional regulator [Paenibacillaceae bacterium]|nr:TetR/AcrR family transcriptional regulator [Paenibacillaceae bacterium]